MQTVMSIRKPLSILLFVVSEILVILINHFLFLYLLSDHQAFAKFTLAFILCHILLFIIQDSTMYKFTMIYWIVTSFVHIYIRLFLSLCICSISRLPCQFHVKPCSFKEIAPRDPARPGNIASAFQFLVELLDDLICMAFGTIHNLPNLSGAKV